jgi:hypothetical protein
MTAQGLLQEPEIKNLEFGKSLIKIKRIPSDHTISGDGILQLNSAIGLVFFLLFF